MLVARVGVLRDDPGELPLVVEHGGGEGQQARREGRGRVQHEDARHVGRQLAQGVRDVLVAQAAGQEQLVLDLPLVVLEQTKCTF